MASLIGGGFWLRHKAEAEEASANALIFEMRTTASGYDLRECLGKQRVRGIALYRKIGTWQPLQGERHTMVAYNEARHIRVEVIDIGDARIVRFYGRAGRKLRVSERTVIEECRTFTPRS